MNKTFLVILILLSPWAWAYNPKYRAMLASDKPQQLENVGIDEHLGQNLDMNLTFQDETGQNVRLGQFFTGHKPVLLTMVYYGCENLCNYHLNGLTDSFKKMYWKSGHDFTFIAVSMDSRETFQQAALKKQAYLKTFTKGAPEGWHFLVGSEASVKALAQNLGFKYRWIEDEKQFAHTAAAYVATPEGAISRYLYGIEFDPVTLRYSLVEASQGKLGSVVDQLLLFCFHFDPTKNKYTLYAFNIMRVSAGLVALVLFIFLIPIWVREIRKGRSDLQKESANVLG